MITGDLVGQALASTRSLTAVRSLCTGRVLSVPRGLTQSRISRSFALCIMSAEGVMPSVWVARAVPPLGADRILLLHTTQTLSITLQVGPHAS